jgi:hypothetical protein
MLFLQIQIGILLFEQEPNYFFSLLMNVLFSYN